MKKRIYKNILKKTNIINLSYEIKKNKRKKILKKISIIQKRFFSLKIRGIFNFFISLKIDRYISVIKLSLLLFPLICISIFSNFIIATIATGINAILSSLIFTIFNKMFFEDKKHYQNQRLIYKKKKILIILIICFMNIFTSIFTIKFQGFFTKIIITNNLL